MKEYQKKMQSFLKILYSIFPFFVSLYFHIPYFYNKQTKYPFLDSLYAAIKIYSGSIEDGIEMTLLLHIVRFMALTITLSILIKALYRISDIMQRLCLLSEKSYLVYGSSPYASKLCSDIGKIHCVRYENDHFVKAPNYVLMFPDDEQNLEFYATNYELMKNSRVYILLEDIERQNFINTDVSVFSIPECAARLYWKEHYPVSSEKIGIIGFGKTGEHILTFGLQMNIISPYQHFEYHIWGDSEEFISLHKGIDKMDPDEIIFHSGKWYSELDLLDTMDRLILCDDESENLSVLSKLFTSGHHHNNIHIYTSGSMIVKKIFGTEKNIHCFGSAEEIATKDNIIDKKTIHNAKKQHELYAKKHNGSSWDKQSVFIRYSNISSSDYEYVIKRLYTEKNVPVEILAHLEHIRWCRYYYLNNWVYGSVKDNEKRIHNCLIPYSELSDEEKQKDIESIEIKLNSEE